jgi:hypothetical protein
MATFAGLRNYTRGYLVKQKPADEKTANAIVLIAS